MVMKPQVVLDTNIWVSAFRSQRGASSKVVNLLRGEEEIFDMHVSVPLVFEYEAFFRRERAHMGLTQTEVETLLDVICEIGVHHDVHYLWRGFSRDPDDAQVLELAVKAACGFIVTYNVRDFVEAESFGIDVVTAHEFLQRLGY